MSSHSITGFGKNSESPPIERESTPPASYVAQIGSNAISAFVPPSSPSPKTPDPSPSRPILSRPGRGGGLRPASPMGELEPQNTPKASFSSGAPASDLPERRPQERDLPRYCKSKEGLLSFDHLLYWLDQTQPGNRGEWEKWAFSQRKFPAQGAGTMCIKKDVYPLDPSQVLSMFTKLVQDKEGYAATISEHDGILACNFIRDEDILEVQHPVRSEFIYRGMLKGVYSDGKCIIQQPAPRACLPTCAAMLIVDQGESYPFETLQSVSLANNRSFLRQVQKAGLEVKEFPPENLPEAVSQYGSVKVGISEKNVGGHAIIVDALDEETITIRDPLHGWRIKMAAYRFFEIATVHTVLAVSK